MKKPEGIPQDIWDATEGLIERFAIDYAAGQHWDVRRSVAHAIMAERHRWAPAVAYFNAYCLDEEEDADNCVSEAQHEAAKAFGNVVRGR